VSPSPTITVNASDADLPSDNLSLSVFQNDASFDLVGTSQFTNGTASVTYKNATNEGTYGYTAIVSDKYNTTLAATQEGTFTVEQGGVLSNPRPRGGTLEKDTTADLSVDADVDTNTTVEFVEQGGTVIGSKTASQSGTVTQSWNAGRGTHAWYARTANGNSRTWLVSFRTPGTITFVNRSGNTLSATANLDIVAPGVDDSVSASNGVFNWEDYSSLEDKQYAVTADATGYNTANVRIRDVARSRTVFMVPDGTSTTTVTFSLDDRTGQFSPTNTTLTVARSIASDGDATDILGSGLVGGDNEIQITLPEGDSVELGVENSEGGFRHLGNFPVPSVDSEETLVISQTPSAWNIDGSSATPNNAVVKDGNVTLSVDITELDGDVVNATFKNYDSKKVLGSDTVDGSGTKTANITTELAPGKSLRWFVEATDNNGAAETSSVFSVQTTGIVTLRDRSTNEPLDNTSATVEFINNEGVVSDVSLNDASYQVFMRNVNPVPQGEIDISANATGYLRQTLSRPNVGSNVTFYLSESGGQFDGGLDVNFELRDYTGGFDPKDTTLDIQALVNVTNETGSNNTTTEYRTIDSGKFGAANNFGTNVIQSGETYLLTIRNGNRTRELGEFSTTSSGLFTLEVTAREYEFDGDRPWTFDAKLVDENATINNQTYGGFIQFNYADKLNNTSYIDIQVSEYPEGPTIFNRRSDDTYGKYSVIVPLTDNQTDRQWQLQFDAQRVRANGTIETVAGERILGDSANLGEEIPDWIKQAASLVALIMLAGLFSPLNAYLGGIAVSVMGGLLWFIGWLPGLVTAGGVIIALGVTVMYKLAQPGGRR
jgi:hypothetical protein